MTLRIKKDLTPSRTTVRLSGRVRSSDLDELERQIEIAMTAIVLDLEEVVLVDLQVVRFLNICAGRGVEIAHGPLYIREWMSREMQKR
jgi:hypothetical protein